MGATQALVFDAHDYEPLGKTADPHGHDESCDCSPKCKECGSARDAYIHSDEAREKGSTLVVRQTATDEAVATEDTAASA